MMISIIILNTYPKSQLNQLGNNVSLNLIIIDKVQYKYIDKQMGKKVSIG